MKSEVKKAGALSVEEFLKEIVSVIRRYLPEEKYKIFLFGSWAKGDALAESDVDIAILGDRAIDQTILRRIKGEVEAIPTLRGADIVDLGAAGERFKQEVLSYGKPL